VQRILNESLRGVLPLKPYVHNIATRLLRECSRKPIGKNLVNNFIKRTPKLRTR
jgi:hypothetical protein